MSNMATFMLILVIAIVFWWFSQVPLVSLVIVAKDARRTFFSLLRGQRRQKIHQLHFVFEPNETPKNRACIVQASRLMLSSPAAVGAANPSKIAPFKDCVSALIRDIVIDYIVPGQRIYPEKTDLIQHYYLTSAKREREVYRAYEHERTFKVTNATSCVHATVLRHFYPKIRINLRCQDDRILEFYHAFLD
jgi:hypothetical protein